MNKQTNERVEETEWHRVTVWGKQAEHCNTYLAKGRQIYVEGRLRTSSYEKEGVKHYSTEVVAEIVQFLGGRAQTEDHKDQGKQPPDPKPDSKPPEDFLPPAPEDDDIPF